MYPGERRRDSQLRGKQKRMLLQTNNRRSSCCLLSSSLGYGGESKQAGNCCGFFRKPIHRIPYGCAFRWLQPLSSHRRRSTRIWSNANVRGRLRYAFVCVLIDLTRTGTFSCSWSCCLRLEYLCGWWGFFHFSGTAPVYGAPAYAPAYAPVYAPGYVVAYECWEVRFFVLSYYCFGNSGPRCV
jgi:hypothetical protein